MKSLVASLIFLIALAGAVAQTNSPARVMSLQDCIQAALQHNFDVQIQRYSPEIALYGVNGAYAGYDPTLNISGTHYDNTGLSPTNNVTLTTQTSTNFSFLPQTASQQNVYRSDLGGTLPWGLNYDLIAGMEKDYDTFYYGFTNVNRGSSQTSDGSVEIDLSQPLLKNFWIDSTRLNIRVAKNRLKYSEQGFRLQVITTVTAVANAYYELIYAQQNVEVQTQALNLAQTQLDQDKQRVEVGSLAPLDVQQDQAQASQSLASLIAAENNLSIDQNTLKNLITDNYSQWHDSAIQPAEALVAPLEIFDLQDSWNEGMTLRPDLLQARLNAERQGIQLKYDFNQLFPELDLKGSYGFAGAGTTYDDTLNEVGRGDRPYYSFGAALSTPLANIGAHATYKTDKLTEKQLLLALKQLEQNVMVQIDNAIKQSQSDYQSVDASRQARIYAEAALDAEQKKYAVGKSTTFTVLQLQNTLTADRAAEIRALANYNESLTDLAQQEGTTLIRQKVDIDVK
jgi:outer membrane protein